MFNDEKVQKELYDDTFSGNKIQVVVGHYNGNLVADLLKNLTNGLNYYLFKVKNHF